MPAGITGNGGRFQQSHGVNEQQDFSNGLKTMTATDAADSPFRRMAGERFSPSQVCVGGNSRKSSETVSGSIVISLGQEDNKRMSPADARLSSCTPGPGAPVPPSPFPVTLWSDPRIFIVS
jgi:hypothetical protein